MEADLVTQMSIDAYVEELATCDFNIFIVQVMEMLGISIGTFAFVVFLVWAIFQVVRMFRKIVNP